MLSAVLLPFLLTLSGTSAAQQASRPASRPGTAAEVTSIFTSEVGIARPLGLAWAGEDRVLVAERAGSGSRLVRIDLFGDATGRVRLPDLGDPSTLAYDPTTRRLSWFDGATLVSVSADDPTGRVRRRDLAIRGPRAAAYDAATGDLYVLHRDGLSRVSPDGLVRTLSLGDLDPAAIAVRPSDGLLYVADRRGRELVGLDREGSVRRTYVMRSVGLQDVRAMTFAPSVDTTDDPDRFDLYVVDRGDADALGRVAEVRPTENDRVFAAAVVTQSATLVRTVQTSQWSPGSPDPSGIVYRPSADRFTVVDSEVDEATGAGYHDVNMWHVTRLGAVTDTGTTHLPAPNFSKEPTGAGYIAASNTLLVSTDSGDKVFFDRPGSDGRFGTADDVVTSISTANLGGFSLGDTEDPEYDPITGHLFILDGTATEVYDVDPVDGTFGNANDTVTHFDVGRYGPTDVEGMSSDPSRNTLLIGERTPQERIFEVTKSGELLRIIDTGSISALDNVSGLALGPASNGSGQQNYYVVDRKTDNGSSSNENDGLMFELAAPTGTTNTPPTLASIGNKTVNEGSTLTFTATATDPNAPPQTLTYSLSGAPSGASINGSSGAFSWTPTEAQGPGSPSFQVCVSDGTASDCETITVTVGEVNSPPSLGAVGNKVASEGAELTFTATATDADQPANTLSFSLTGAPTGAAIGGSSGAFSWTPTSGQVGDHTFGVCVSDGVAQDCETITVTVTPPNVAPTLDPIGNRSVAELAQLTFTATATDPGAPPQTLVFSLVGAPSGASIDASSGVFTWTPTEAQGPGTPSFQVCVSDGPAADCETISVTVGEVNVAPVLNPIGNKSATEGTQLTFTATASDADLPANGLAYALTGAPAGATIGGANGVFSWTPTAAQGPGVYAFDVCVADASAQDCETISVTVADHAVIFSDGFESGTLAAWANSGMVVQQLEVANGTWAARATSTGSKVNATATLPAPQWEIYYKARVKVVSQSSNLTYLLRLRTKSGAIGGVFRAANGNLGIRSNPASQRYTSSTFVTTGVWHDLQVRVLVNGSNGSSEVWFDGVRIGQLSVTGNWGAKQIAKVMLADDQGGRSYDFVFDDVVVDSLFIGP